jgi:hypothetical protein
MLLSASIVLLTVRQRAILANFALPDKRVFYVSKWVVTREPFQYLGNFQAAINS